MQKRNLFLGGIVVFGLMIAFLGIFSGARDSRVQAAQADGDLTYGSSVSGTLAGGDTSSHTFSGAAGDHIDARAFATRGTLDVTLSLTTPAGDTLAGDSDLFSPQPLDGTIAYVLPESGTYTLTVGAAGGTSGDYVLQLVGRADSPHDLIVADAPVRVAVAPGGATQRLHFAASPDCAQTVSVRDITVGAPFPYLMRLADPQGSIIAQVGGRRQMEDRFTVPVGSGLYEVSLSAANAAAEGEVLVTVTCATTQPPCPIPLPTAEAQLVPTPSLGMPTEGIVQDQAAEPLSYNGVARGVLAAPGDGAGEQWRQFRFSGRSGDLVTIQVIGLTGERAPQFLVAKADSSLLAQGGTDMMSIFSRDSLYSFFLIESGDYTIYVGGQAGGAGEFVVRLFGRTPQMLTFIPSNFETIVSLNQGVALADAPALRTQGLTFNAESDCATTLTLTQDTDAAYGMVLRDEQGVVIAQANQLAEESRFVFAPNSGRYEVFINSPDGAPGSLRLLVTCAESAPQCANFNALISTPRPGYTLVMPTRTPTLTPSITPTLATATATPTVTITASASRPPTVTLIGSLNFRTPTRAGGGVRATARPGTFTPTPPGAPTQPPNNGDGGGGAVCGNASCEAGENSGNCPNDCGSGGGGGGPVCNENYVCEAGENQGNCPLDCGIPIFCGDGFCDADAGEDSNTCSQDCS